MEQEHLFSAPSAGIFGNLEIGVIDFRHAPDLSKTLYSSIRLIKDASLAKVLTGVNKSLRQRLHAHGCNETRHTASCAQKRCDDGCQALDKVGRGEGQFAVDAIEH